MRTRTKARQRAVEALFEAEQRDTTPFEVLERNPDTNEYARELVSIVAEHQNRIDEILESYLSDRPLSRMPALDRAIARVAVAELLHRDDIDTSVIVSQAVELAELLSTDQSAKFLNGLIGAIANMRGTFSTL